MSVARTMAGADAAAAGQRRRLRGDRGTGVVTMITLVFALTYGGLVWLARRRPRRLQPVGRTVDRVPGGPVRGAGRRPGRASSGCARACRSGGRRARRPAHRGHALLQLRPRRHDHRDRDRARPRRRDRRGARRRSHGDRSRCRPSGACPVKPSAHTGPRLLRALFGVTALVGLIVVAPIVLAAVGRARFGAANPLDSVPPPWRWEAGAVRDTIAAPLEDAAIVDLVLRVALCVGWVAIAVIAITTVVEVEHLVRHRGLPLPDVAVPRLVRQPFARVIASGLIALLPTSVAARTVRPPSCRSTSPWACSPPTSRARRSSIVTSLHRTSRECGGSALVGNRRTRQATVWVALPSRPRAGDDARLLHRAARRLGLLDRDATVRR